MYSQSWIKLISLSLSLYIYILYIYLSIYNNHPALKFVSFFNYLSIVHNQEIKGHYIEKKKPIRIQICKILSVHAELHRTQ